MQQGRNQSFTLQYGESRIAAVAFGKQSSQSCAFILPRNFLAQNLVLGLLLISILR